MFPYYPINDFGPVMKGMVIGGLGIFHVFLAQFAIGGGMLLCYFQWRDNKYDDQLARRFVDGYFRWLVLVSFVTGALTGVAMWLTTIQISPRTIGLMVDEFHWLWATEWTFFCVEVASGYAFYRYAKVLDGKTRLLLLQIYAVAAWMSLFWINGILSWQLTPGGWLEDRSIWAGFFNATFWPSLIYRTLASMAIAGLVAAVVVNVASGFSARREVDIGSPRVLVSGPDGFDADRGWLVSGRAAGRQSRLGNGRKHRHDFVFRPRCGRVAAHRRLRHCDVCQTEVVRQRRDRRDAVRAGVCRDGGWRVCS